MIIVGESTVTYKREIVDVLKREFVGQVISSVPYIKVDKIGTKWVYLHLRCCFLGAICEDKYKVGIDYFIDWLGYRNLVPAPWEPDGFKVLYTSAFEAHRGAVRHMMYRDECGAFA